MNFALCIGDYCFWIEKKKEKEAAPDREESECRLSDREGRLQNK